MPADASARAPKLIIAPPLPFALLLFPIHPPPLPKPKDNDALLRQIPLQHPKTQRTSTNALTALHPHVFAFINSTHAVHTHPYPPSGGTSSRSATFVIISCCCCSPGPPSPSPSPDPSSGGPDVFACEGSGCTCGRAGSGSIATAASAGGPAATAPEAPLTVRCERVRLRSAMASGACFAEEAFRGDIRTSSCRVIERSWGPVLSKAQLATNSPRCSGIYVSTNQADLYRDHGYGGDLPRTACAAGWGDRHVR